MKETGGRKEKQGDSGSRWGGDAFEARGARQSRSARILLAEDDEEIRGALERLLAFDGYEVLAVDNGGELLDYLSGWILGDTDEAPADVIITDIRMPGFNGLSILEGLRARGWTQPVIVMSAFGDEEIRERVERLGAAIFFPKPFEPSELERAVERLSERA
jgi:DNA-binding response OmpR family regulator